MELTGTFEFSHVNMVVINRTRVFKKELVGKKQVPLWHEEHIPKVYKPEEIKAMIQGYLNSPFHRVCPSCDTINIYHKTKEELKNEKKAKEELIKACTENVPHRGRNCSCGKATSQAMMLARALPVGYAVTDVRPGQLVTVKQR